VNRVELDIQIFARHVRLNEAHFKALFGERPPLAVTQLSGGTQASANTVDVTVAGNSLMALRVVLPLVKHSSVVLGRKDFVALTQPVPSEAFTPTGRACTVKGPEGAVVLADAVEFHPRHVRWTKAQADSVAADVGTKVEVTIHGDKPRVLNEVAARLIEDSDSAVLRLELSDAQVVPPSSKASVSQRI